MVVWGLCTFERFSKRLQHEPRQAVSLVKWLRWVGELGGTGSEGITKAGLVALARFMKSSIWCLPAPSSWVGEAINKGAIISTNVYIPGVAPTFPPLTVILKLVNLGPPCLSLVLFKLLPLCWSSESEFMSK